MCVASFVQNSESNKASYRSKEKKKNGRTDGTREGFDETSLLIVILSRGPCSRPIRHVLPQPAGLRWRILLFPPPLPPFIKRMLSNR